METNMGNGRQKTNPISDVMFEYDLLYDWRFTANPFVLAICPLRLTTSNLFLQLNTCGYSHYVTF
jgi:hypothetical protein